MLAGAAEEGQDVDHAERELPGDVMVSIREAQGYVRSSRVFAELLGFSYDTLRRLEMVKWGTLPQDWERPVDRQDVEAFVNAGYVQQGDELWLRFRAAFVWQHAVIRYGERVYEQSGEDQPLFAAASRRHIKLLAQSVATRETRRYTSAAAYADNAPEEVIVEKITSEVVLVMTRAGLVREDDEDVWGEEYIEHTRALQAQAAGQSQAETSYLRTLRIAYELAEGAAGEMFAPPRSGAEGSIEPRPRPA
jgi:hypothetical protein